MNFLLCLLAFVMMAFYRARRGSRRFRGRGGFRRGSRRGTVRSRFMYSGSKRFPMMVPMLKVHETYTLTAGSKNAITTGVGAPYSGILCLPQFTVLNTVPQGNAAYQRSGRGILMKSVEVNILCVSGTQPQGTGGSCQACIIYDRRWNAYTGNDAANPNAAGDSGLALAIWSGKEQTTFNTVIDPIHYLRNMNGRDRFKICQVKRWQPATDLQGQSSSTATQGVSSIRTKAIRMFCKLGGAETIYDSGSDNVAPALGSHIMNGALLLAVSSSLNSNVVSWEVNWRLRFSDKA